MKTLTLLVCAVTLAAAPLTGTWKLNRQKSTTDAPLPSFIHNETMGFPSNSAVHVEVPPTRFLTQDGRSDALYRVDVSADRKVLTVTRVLSFNDQSGKQFHTVLVLEKQ